MWVGMQYAKVRSNIKSNQVRISAFINKGAMPAQKSPNSSITKITVEKSTQGLNTILERMSTFIDKRAMSEPKSPIFSTTKLQQTKRI